MNRKSQFYMFAALIFISTLFFGIASISQIRIREKEDFQNYRDNYLYEARIVINNAVREHHNISAQLRDYTEAFIRYGDERNLELGIVYIYSRNQTMYIVNYLKETILISTESYNGALEPGQESVLAFEHELWIDYEDEKYYYSFLGPYETEIKALFVKQDG
jgi:hypothetical protein